ncbi:class I SAM-dependent methyltransferase [Evansella clarkii]|uniref:class I SAM-dependent methyltransferase n=1 Tax=Evansella clarkii TaxID=79879 RepID=UPI0009981658|nr:class I SAM-dependent methyltransferase [Evansella clarkii]
MAGERFNPEKADKLLSEKRYKVLDPQKVLDYFEVEQGNQVADLGAGNGFFTIPVARRTGAPVYAVDIEPKMLELLDERAKGEGLTNIAYVVSNLENIQLDDNTADKAIISLVLHEVPDLTKALQEVKRILKPGGQVLVIEWEAKESEMGPPLHERIGSQDMVNILSENGYKTEVTHFDEAIYGLKGTVSE